MNSFIIVDGKRRSQIRASQVEEFFTAFQLKHQPTERTLCPLCNMKLSDEHIYYNSGEILIVDTKQKKGHRERIMLLTEEHGVQHPKELLAKAIQQLVSIGREVFDSDFALLSDKFSTVKNHWHIIRSDLDPNADDYQQIMDTPLILITENRL